MEKLLFDIEVLKHSPVVTMPEVPSLKKYWKTPKVFRSTKASILARRRRLGIV